jgi:peroxiredoxin
MNSLKKGLRRVCELCPKKYVFLFLFAVVNLANALGQPRKDIIIYGKLSPKLVEELTADFKLEVYTNILGIDSNINKTYKVAINENSFKVKIKSTADVVYFDFKSFPIERWRGLFLAQPGDTLYFDIKGKDDFTFKSNDAQLYACQMDLKNANVPVVRTFQNGDTSVVSYIKFKRDSVLKDFNRILLKYSHLLSPENLELLKINIYSDLNFGYLESLRVISQEKGLYNEKEENLAASAIIERYKKNRPPKDSTLITNSISYASYIVELERAWNGLYSDTNNFKQDRFERMFKSINTNYSGLLKQKVLTVFFLTYFNQSYNAIKDLNSIIAQISDMPYKNILLGLRISKTSGNNAFPFKLESDKGKFYSLEDFRGKVIICKFWFTGCGGCAQEERELKPLRDKYNKNPNVVFLSINVDYDKKTWVQGLTQGIYSSTQEINLSTNGLGYRHPMLDFYSYHSFPQLLLIDKNSKIINSSPVRVTDKKSLLELDSLLQTHL